MIATAPPFEVPLFFAVLGTDGATWLVSTLTLPQHPVCNCGANGETSRTYAEAIAARLNIYARAASKTALPKEPTPQMIAAGQVQYTTDQYGGVTVVPPDVAAAVYRAMVAAASAPAVTA